VVCLHVDVLNQDVSINYTLIHDKGKHIIGDQTSCSLDCTPDQMFVDWTFQFVVRIPNPLCNDDSSHQRRWIFDLWGRCSVLLLYRLLACSISIGVRIKSGSRLLSNLEFSPKNTPRLSSILISDFSFSDSDFRIYS
jgi:hypothetical protein